MRKLALSLAVSAMLAVATVASAALPQAGPFAGKTGVHPINGFPDVVTFVSSNGGKSLKKFTFQTLSCFGYGAAPTGVNPFALPESVASVGTLTVAANGTFTATAVPAKFTSTSATPTTATIKGVFLTAQSATGTISIKQTMNGTSCNATMKFTAQPGTVDSLGLTGP